MRSRNAGILLFCVLFVLLAVLIVACAETPSAPTAKPQVQPTAPPAGTPQPAELVSTAAPPAPATGDDLSRVRAAGVLEVSTSLDNPPFEMYNPQSQPDGYDIALINEVAKRLGVRAHISDYPFESLLATLQTGQADAAIAAMAVTKDRQQVVDFTRAYYRGEDAVLAASNSPIGEIKSMADLASHRVGVQSGSVYESYLLNTLIANDQMPKENLFSYGMVGDAVTDLQTGRIDLVVLDREPAATYVAGGQAKYLGKSMYVQEYAIALRKASTLASEMNTILNQLQMDGTLGKLAEEYLKIPANQLVPPPTPMPTPASTPTPAPTPTLAPVALATWVADLSYDDSNGPVRMNPGQPFNKGWRMKNVGTIAWTPDYYMGYYQGNTPVSQMGGQNTKINKPVAPGEMVDVTVPMIAPMQPGTYNATWQMYTSSGTPIGKASLSIYVPGPPTQPPPPPPTQAPASNINFWVDRTDINAGEAVNFSWNVSGVRAIYFCRGSLDNCQDAEGRGGSQERPDHTMTYYLKVIQNDNSQTSRQYTINVHGSSGNAPVIREFSSEADGSCANIWWIVDNNPSRVFLVDETDNRGVWDGAPASESKHDCPPSSGDVTYELQVWGPGGSGPQKAHTTVHLESKPQPKTVTVNHDGCNNEYGMNSGDTLKVKLDAAGGSGYEWRQEGGYDTGVLQQQGGVSKSCDSGIGAACHWTWTYKAKSGETTIKFKLYAPSGDSQETCSVKANVGG